MENKLEKKATFQTISNSVNIQMQRRLLEDWEPPLQDDTGTAALEVSVIGIEPTSTALAMAITRFYYKDNIGKFQEANLSGILCFIVDRIRKSRYLRLYDLNTSELLF